MQSSTLAKVLVTAAVAVGGAGFLVFQGLASAQTYRAVNDLVKDPLQTYEGKELKVHGTVVPGSIIESVVNQETHRTFVLEFKGSRIRVFNIGPKPDTFKDKSDVIATGHLVHAATMQADADALCKDLADHGKPSAACPVRVSGEQDWVVDSSELSAKCPSKYADGASNDLKTKYDPNQPAGQ
jgi:cytochrome c-type biogenesis protein CcmE